MARARPRTPFRPFPPPPQLAYALTWLLAHALEFFPDAAAAWRRRKARAPRRAPPPSLDARTLSLVTGFTVQAAEKLVLAEGSKAVLAAGADAGARGAYGLAANVGSLAVRTIFQPVEEAAFLAFARPSRPADAADLLRGLCRGVVLVGCAGAAFGPPFAFAFVRGAYGPRWACGTPAPAALAAYAAYTALLAANGVLEAFVHARGGPGELARGNAALLALAGAGAGAGFFAAARYGAVGLIAADSLAMALRIGWSLGAVSRLLGRVAPRPRDLAPAPRTLAALATAAALCAASDSFFLGQRCAPGAPPFWPAAVRHAAVGAAALAGAAAVARSAERDTLASLASMRKGKQA